MSGKKEEQTKPSEFFVKAQIIADTEGTRVIVLEAINKPREGIRL